MIRYALPLVAVSALASPALAADVQIQATGPVVELTVNETVKARPDIATVGAGVTSRAPTAVAAMQENAKAMDAVVAKIKALGIAKDDIQTTGINLYAQYDYNQATQRQVFRGYQASNQVSVILRKIDDTGKVLDALVAAGATDLNGPNFSIDDDTEAKAQARKTAMERARNQAMEYARMAGYSGVRLLEINEAISGQTPMPMVRKAYDAIQTTAAAAPPVEPGLVGTGVTVTVKYELTR
ncbi:SIMPL domain-containing protein [Tsuneonella sp. CC-YZS046]|uniref:SIMPL domain-containing protein n=1 Tax=Tsuneonella sp. CC-YZS046 TaxID=3042152 RepID=UPI002D7944C4|nr:SIMPL domain-containing protein [Tsuneonella sp. CC-YZS046]WRO67416.1 SIMPL domain-containing protein [Tsuneonella sp. CC-YZS046]